MTIPNRKGSAPLSAAHHHPSGAGNDSQIIAPQHWDELVVGSAIDPAVAQANVVSFGPGGEHWEDSRAELIRHKRWLIQTEKLANNGHAQGQPGWVAAALISLQRKYAFLREGGWRSTCTALPGFEAFNCWRPDQPRLGADRRVDKRTGRSNPVKPKPVKYETQPAHPRGGGLFVPVVPLPQWQAIARRAGLPEPDAQAQAAGYQTWLLAHPQVPVVVAEGLKKLLCAISCGHAAVAVPGVTMGWRTDSNNNRQLIAELVALAQADRPMVVVFDRERKETTAKKVQAAAGILRSLLRDAGAAASIARLPHLPGAEKVGLDDLVVARGAEALDTALAEAQSATAIAPYVPRLRPFNAIAPAGCYLGEALSIPTDRRLVCLAAGMGAGKTELLAAALRPLMQAGVRVVLITHRRSLGAALADRLGLPWGDDAKPGSDQRQLGIALCADSVCRQSAMRFNAAEWRGAIVVIDEAAQVLLHALHGRGTAIARRRPEVLDNLGQLLSAARAAWISDAHLDNKVVQAFESAVGEPAWLIGSLRRPAAGRELIIHHSRGNWHAALAEHLHRREPVWIATAAAEATSPNSACNLAILVSRYWPGARVLVVDRDTVNDPEHDAYKLAANPDAIASQYDVVVATPAVAAGLSVTLRNHFKAVLGICGGTTPPADVAQAVSRVRDDVPRHIFAPERSPGNHLQVGCGSLDPKVVLKHLDRHAQAAVAAALSAGWDAECGAAGPWLTLWAAQAGQQNRARLSYANTVVALLEREGYAIRQAEMVPGAESPAMLKELADMEKLAEKERVIAADLLTDEQAAKLKDSRQRLSKAEKAQLQRWRIDRAWALQGAAPSEKLLDAHDDGAHRKVVMGWALSDPTADVAVARHDRNLARDLAPRGTAWAPDLADGLMAPKLAAMRILGLGAWVQRRDTFTADDAALKETAATASQYANDVVQRLGLRPGKKPITLLRQLLGLVGMKLEAKRLKGAANRDAYSYRVVPDPLPDRIAATAVVGAWLERMDGPKNPLHKEGQVLAHECVGPIARRQSPIDKTMPMPVPCP